MIICFEKVFEFMNGKAFNKSLHMLNFITRKIQQFVLFVKRLILIYIQNQLTPPTQPSIPLQSLDESPIPLLMAKLN